jgi:hypothetical protein
VQKFDPITPDDIAPMAYDFAEFLADYGDTIVNATVTALPSTITIQNKPVTANTVVNFVARDAAVGSYVLTFHIETAGGAEWHRTAGLTVKASL